MNEPLKNKTFSDEEIKISICCATYNHEKFIEKCIEGFLEQECNFRVEIIIYDDASTDRTTKIVKQFADKYPSIIQPIFSEKNQFSLGVKPYYAYVFPKARGKYIAICDGDDFWSDKEKLSIQCEELDKDSNLVITYGKTRAIKANEVVENFKSGAERNLSSRDLMLGEPINTLTACFRNIFKEKMPAEFLRNAPIGDLTVWGMLGYYGYGKFLTKLKKTNYRIHEGGILSLIKKEKGKYMTALTYLNLAAFHHQKGKTLESQKCIRKATIYLNSLSHIYLLNLRILKPFSIFFKTFRKLFNSIKKRM